MYNNTLEFIKKNTGISDVARSELISALRMDMEESKGYVPSGTLARFDRVEEQETPQPTQEELEQQERERERQSEQEFFDTLRKIDEDNKRKIGRIK